MTTITRKVWILSLVSLLTDAASEMLYPIMPIYLRALGYSVALIGVLEGVAEATAGLSKGYFGAWSDGTGRRAPFIQVGYALSAISKPMMGLFTLPVWVLFARTIDRLGKGIRTGARDAMLSDESAPGTRGTVFGFHRSMDSIGAVIGPAAAVLYLRAHPGDYRPLFFIAFGPAVVAVLISLLLRDSTAPRKDTEPRTSMAFRTSLRYWSNAPREYRRLVTGLLVFALCNSSDVFLLLRARDAGLTDAQTIGAYITYNVVFAIAAWPIGMLSDRIGLKPVFIAGLCAFAGVYLGMAIVHGRTLVMLLFVVYGLYAAATEGIAKAWIAGISDRRDTATAIGTFGGLQSVCALVASSVAGVMWAWLGPTATLAASGVIALTVAAYIGVATARPTEAH